MQGRIGSAFALIALLLASSISGVVTNDSFLSNEFVQHSGDYSAAPDIPQLRIGDEWIYDTDFDVASLISQANVSASLSTLTGDTNYEITDIFFMMINGTQSLVYEVSINGDFTSGNNGATFNGVTGRLDIEYTGTDIIRVRDLAVVNSEFSLLVEFFAYNLPWGLELADITFDTWYEPPKEKHDFPLHLGDQWHMPFQAGTDVTGTSNYFDPSDFNTNTTENNSWQVTDTGTPSESGDGITYSGCDDSYKIMEWNSTGVNTGFEWYCPAVRGAAWMRVDNGAGFTIDWMLKSYDPADSWGVQTGSNPGARNVAIDVETQFFATLPNSEQTITATYETSTGQPQNNKNLQLRYELDQHIANPITNGTGIATAQLNVSDVVDDTPSSDDHTSNGVIVWDPVTKIVGTKTVVIDLSVAAVDLIAKADSLILTRHRGEESTILSQSIGYAALPGDILEFSIPAQNRGVLTSPATEIEVLTPSGETSRTAIPAIGPYAEQRISLNWTVPIGEAIGNKTLSFTVDPDQMVTQDANRSNNAASVNIFIGRMPIGEGVVDSGKFTFENVTLNATSSYDEDGGEVECIFEVESRPGLIDVLEAPDCQTHWNWSDDGEWEVKITVTDDELDSVVFYRNVTVLNRAPYLNLTAPLSVEVESSITINASDSGDIDTISPSNQDVTISWPDSVCQEGLTQDTCTIIPVQEGELVVKAVATDDDGETTEREITINVLNIAPVIEAPVMWYGGQELEADENGTWHLNEAQAAQLIVAASDSLSDIEALEIKWLLSDQSGWNTTTIGPRSVVDLSWNLSGLHNLSVYAVDDDGVSTDSMMASVFIHNLAPTITGLPEDTSIFEDATIPLSVEVSDTPYDMDSLVICWDLDADIDMNSDGDSTNDCQYEGMNLNASWITSGMRVVTVTVTDNDGASSNMSVNITVVNVPPRSVITAQGNVSTLNEGDSITLDATAVRESASDIGSLVYNWSSTHLDSNGNGDKSDDVDYSGLIYNIDDLPAGEWEVTLTVTDDDGFVDSSTITLYVKEKPSEGVLDSISQSLGSVGSGILAILVLIVGGLAAYLVISKRRVAQMEDKYSQFAMTHPGTPQPAQHIPVPAPSGDVNPFAPSPTAPEPLPVQAAMPSPQQIPEPSTALTPVQPLPTQPASITPEPVNQGPPIPASGLPPGWTMEQWSYYGQQWLDANSQQSSVESPTTNNTTTSSASTELGSLLDDLDF